MNPSLENSVRKISPGDSFAQNVASSVPRGSRRDFVRAGAVLAAMGSLPKRAASASPTTHHTSNPVAQETSESLSVPFDPFGEPITLDPHRAPNWGPFWVLFPHIWSGLLGFDENGGVILDLAESFEPDETAEVWTATIRPDLTFESGSPVNAQTFVNSWKRALDPDLPAPMSRFFSLVAGYEAYIRGESSDIGFTVVDDLSLEIQLSEPFSSFPAAAATFGWSVLDLEAMELAEIPTPAAVGLGMWKVSSFDPDAAIVVEPHPNSPTPVSPSIASIRWVIADGPEATESMLAMYGNDEIAIADVPSRMVATVEENDALSPDLVTIGSQSSTLAIGMDFNQEPFNDVRYRQAVAMAIDRRVWSETIQGGEFAPADAIVPPAVVLTANYTPAILPDFSPDDAAQLLTEAGYEPESAPFEIVYYQPASDSVEQQEQAAALLVMIEENSGLMIRHDTSLTNEQIVRLRRDNGGTQFGIDWWWSDSDTPSMLEDIGMPSSSAMAGVYNWGPDLEPVDDQTLVVEAASDFIDVIDTANAAVDEDERNRAFRIAEQLMIDNAVVVPLGHWVQRYVQKQWLTGTRQGPWSGSIPVRFDADVQLTPSEVAPQ